MDERTRELIKDKINSLLPLQNKLEALKFKQGWQEAKYVSTMSEKTCIMADETRTKIDDILCEIEEVI